MEAFVTKHNKSHNTENGVVALFLCVLRRSLHRCCRGRTFFASQGDDSLPCYEESSNHTEQKHGVEAIEYYSGKCFRFGQKPAEQQDEDGFYRSNSGNPTDSEETNQQIPLIIRKRGMDEGIRCGKQQQAVHGHGDFVHNILEKIHTGSVGNRNAGFVQVVDPGNAGTAAQGSCFIKGTIKGVAEAFPIRVFRVGLMYDQPGDMSLTDMIEDYSEE